MLSSPFVRSVAGCLRHGMVNTASRCFCGLSYSQTQKLREAQAKKNAIEDNHQCIQIRSESTDAAALGSPVKRKEVAYDDLISLIDNGDIQLIDVREPKELESGHIPTSVNIPLTKLKSSLQLTEEEFYQQFGIHRPRQCGCSLVFYGLSNVKGITALEIAFRLGLKKARHYPGGYQDWCTRTDDGKCPHCGGN